MSYTISTLINDVTSSIHGTQASKVPQIYGLINRAARTVLLDVDPKETQRIVQLASQVFNDVFDYAAPTDVKGDRLIDLRLTAERAPREVFVQDYAVNFDISAVLNLNNAFYTQWNTGVKTLRIEAPFLKSPLVLADMYATTGWSVTTGAQNLSLDTTNNPAGGGALQFDLAAGSSTGSVEISSLSPVDVTDSVNIDTLFYWVYLPSGSAITNLILKWGSDYTSNYYTYTATTTQQGTAFQNGWNLISVPWASATLVGSPTITAYDSVQLTITYNSTLQTGVKFCYLTSNQGAIFEAQYYSKYLFRNPTTNAFQETVTDATDNNLLINLDTESYNLLFNQLAILVAQSLQGADAQYDATFYDSKYQEALKKYKAQNPSEAMIKAEPYYKMGRKGYNRFNPGFLR